LQAADFLAIEGHVKATCSTLAARLFPEEPKNHSRRSEDDPTQVLFYKHATRFVMDTCRALAARPFVKEPKSHNRRTKDDPTQVLFYKHAMRSVCDGSFVCRDEQFPSAFNMF
jgi:hypothetical protein